MALISREQLEHISPEQVCYLQRTTWDGRKTWVDEVTHLCLSPDGTILSFDEVVLDPWPIPNVVHHDYYMFDYNVPLGDATLQNWRLFDVVPWEDDLTAEWGL